LALAGAKDRSGEVGAQATDAGGDAKDAAVEAAVGVKDDVQEGVTDTAEPPSGGQVSAVDPTPDSDAITSDAVEGGTINGASTKASPRGSATTRLAEEGGSTS
jgi:hypothetical protein